MCTSLTLLTHDHYFGRNLDLEYAYKETVTVTPRNFPLTFRHAPTLSSHYAMIGMAFVSDNYPLYYDATNEKGLSIAGLNFPRNAAYHKPQEGKHNITPFELIPWLLGQCSTVAEALTLLRETNLTDEPFSEDLPLSPLHFMISDRSESLTVEPMSDGLKLYPNPLGILTNNPPFPLQMFYLNNYMHLSPHTPKNFFSTDFPLEIYSNGMGALGMPGDWSSQSRFVKTAFLKLNSVCGSSEKESVSQFFHLLGAVEHPRGCVVMDNGLCEITLYSSCCNTDRGIYYYRTYQNSGVSSVDLHRENLDDRRLISYPLKKTAQFDFQN